MKKIGRRRGDVKVARPPVPVEARILMNHLVPPFSAKKPQARMEGLSAGARKIEDHLDPFGGGETVRYRGRSDSESESFQDAPADRKASSQLELASYTQKRPGRPASRMLLKMVKESAHGSVEGVANDPNPTPPAAVHFLLTVMIPQLGAKANHRTQRELRTICTAIDMLQPRTSWRRGSRRCRRRRWTGIGGQPDSSCSAPRQPPSCTEPTRSTRPTSTSWSKS